MSESNNKSFPELLKKLPKADYSSGGAGAMSKVYRAGNVYHVSKSARHFAQQSANYKDIVIFNEPGRVPVAKQGLNYLTIFSL